MWKMSSSSPQSLQLYQKETPTQVFTCEYCKSFRDTIFYRANLVTDFELSFSIRKEFPKKKLSGEIASALISLIHVQIQLPASRSTTMSAFAFLANLLNFIITKYLKQEVIDDLRICMDKYSPCGLSITGDLSISWDQKVMMLLLPKEKCPLDFYQGIYFTPKIC